MPKLRGEFFVAFASLLSFTSMIFLALIFVKIYITLAQSFFLLMSFHPLRISRLVKQAHPLPFEEYQWSTSMYHDTSNEAFFAAFGGVIPIVGLYTQDGTAPLGSAAGLRQEYRFGVRGYCAYVDSKHGACGKHTTASRFQPYAAITSDMPLNYTQFSYAVIPPSTFRDGDFLGSFTRTASYMLLLGFIFIGLSLVLGLVKSQMAFSLATLFCFLAGLFLLLGAALWTVAVKRAESINNLTIPASPGTTPSPVGITVSGGAGLYLAWAAFALMVVSSLPYLISCCTFRGN